MEKRVTVIGGLNMDIKAKSKEQLRAKDSNPSVIEITPGGVARNIAHNLALLGVQTTLLGAVGMDMESQSIVSQTAKSGVITEHLYKSSHRRIGKYIAILNEDGEMNLAVSDMDILEELDTAYLESKVEIIKNSHYVVCDANLSVSCLRFIINTCRDYAVPICVDPVSAAKAVKLQGLLQGIELLTPNALELEVLAKTTGNVEQLSGELIQLGVKNVVTTLGPDGLCHSTASKSTCYPSMAKTIVDVTGAGDSLTAGIIYGLLSFNSYSQACRCGLAAAAITLASKDTVSSDISSARITDLLHRQ